MKNTEKKFLVSEILAFEFVARNSPYCDENTSPRNSMCYKKVLRFKI